MMNKIVLAFILLILWPVAITRAQSPQDEFGKELQRKLSLYYDNNVPVDLQLFFHQPVYRAGDTAWFNVSFLSARELRPIAGRQIIQVYVTDRKGTPLLHQQVVAREGFGVNQIVIPETFTPGVYTVVAFSEGMKNHDASFFFHSDLVVSGGKRFARQAPSVLALFPEGGNFVAGVTNRIVVAAAPGAVISVRDGYGEVAACVTDSVGWGSFYVHPRLGEQYKVTSRSTSAVLPIARANRVNLLLTAPAAQGPLRVVVQAGAEYPAGENLYLVLSAQDKIHYSVKLDFNTKKAAIVNVPYATLPHGLAQVTLFRADGSVEAERLFFVKAAAAQVVCKVDKTRYGTRELVTIRVHSATLEGQALLSQFGVRVISNDLFPEDAPADGAVLMASHNLAYGATVNARALQAGAATRDNLLIAQSWKRFSWSDVWSQAVKNEHKYKNYQYLTAHIKSREPLPDAVQITFFLQHDTQVYVGNPDKDGNIDLPLLHEFERTDEVFYRVEHKGKKIDGVSLEMPGDARFNFSLPTFNATDKTDPYLMFASAATRMDAAYAAQDKKDAEEADLNTWMEKDVYHADHAVRLSDFLLLPTMAETLREIVPSTLYRVHNQRETIRVVIKGQNALPAEDPVYVIDGVMTDDTHYFLSLKPANVSTLKVITSPERLERFGAIGRNGILVVETNLPGNAANVPRSPTSFGITGLNPVRSFHSLRFGSSVKRIPSLKSALYWDPQVVTDKDGNAVISFYTPDNTGNFKVQIHGITASGEQVFSEERFSVGFDQRARN